MRDPKTEEFKEMIGQGAKVKMDESGNILLNLIKQPFFNAGRYWLRGYDYLIETSAVFLLTGHI